MKESLAQKDHSNRIEPPTVWQENHGNWLLAFVVAICVVGASILVYRQNRFVPVGFPNAEAIEEPDDEPAVATIKPNESSIVIQVTGAANDSGSLMLAIYDSEPGFNDRSKAIFLQSVKLFEGEGMWEVEVKSLPAEFAIAAYHDENDDKELNRNRFGIPTERYGFSRNARGLTGPPSYKDAKIKRPSGGQTIQVFVR